MRKKRKFNVEVDTQAIMQGCYEKAIIAEEEFLNNIGDIIESSMFVIGLTETIKNTYRMLKDKMPYEEIQCYIFNQMQKLYGPNYTKEQIMCTLEDI